MGSDSFKERGLLHQYPFTAIVGQETVKTALILNAVDPSIGGVLISGPKGSGKSLLVRAFSEVLPDIEHVADCSFHCSPADPTNMCPTCLSRFESGEKIPIDITAMKIVQVPLSVSDDMLVGSLDIDKALENGVKVLRPGLLADANKNILYIDEVNLLPDHLTDGILDAAASGWNIVEREGMSFQHPSRFILVGTMNPEEGELRPQILDRFGVHAETKTVEDVGLRTQIIQRNEKFREDPISFIEAHREEVSELRLNIEAARKRLFAVDVPEEIYSRIAAACSQLRVDGFRPDIVALKVARAMSAFHGREVVQERELEPSLELALGHRTRESGLAPPPSPSMIREALKNHEKGRLELDKRMNIPSLTEVIPISRETFRKIRIQSMKNLMKNTLFIALMSVFVFLFIDILRGFFNLYPLTPFALIMEGFAGSVISLLLAFIPSLGSRKTERPSRFYSFSDTEIETKGKLSRWISGDSVGSGSTIVRYENDFETELGSGRKILEPIEVFQNRYSGSNISLKVRNQKGWGIAVGSARANTVSSSSRGRFTWYQIPRGKPRDIAIVPTILAAALHQSERRIKGSTKLAIEPQDIRIKVRDYRAPFSIILLVDMSLSMIGTMDNLVEAVYSLHRNVFRRRDRVGLIVFKGAKSYIIQHPSTNLNLVVRKLREIGASDFTPMAAGLLQALKVLKQEKLRNRDALPNLIIFSDGIANVPLERGLSPLTRRRILNEAQADSIDVAHLLAKEKYRVHVINTNHSRYDMEAKIPMADGLRHNLTPTQFLIELARNSKGVYYGLSLQGEEPEDLEVEEEYEKIFIKSFM